MFTLQNLVQKFEYVCMYCLKDFMCLPLYTVDGSICKMLHVRVQLKRKKKKKNRI